MNDEMAKRIVKAYQIGLTDLSSYVQAIEYCAEKYPDMTMVDILDWVNEDSTPIYKCDPEKNTTCTKESCHINGGECYATLNVEYKKEEKNDQG